MNAKQATRIRKTRNKYGADAFKKFGRKGGSPILLSWAKHRPVKGYIAKRTSN